MRILVTGHTGFKGSWLSLMLFSKGHEVFGIALPPEKKGIFEKANISRVLRKNSFLDIRDKRQVEEEISRIEPDFIFHLAAQSLVRKSFSDFYETYSTNVLGTLNILEAVTLVPNIKGIIVVTTDKVYKNTEKEKPFLETDELGGKDPYSSSKTMADVLTQNWSNHHQEIPVGIARAGNVIGGGDIAENRLLPDIFKSIENSTALRIRNPNSVRPWQHVFDCLNGYVLFMSHVLKGQSEILNFGPEPESFSRVEEVVKKTLKYFDINKWEIEPGDEKEAKFLTLDSSKAKNLLNWENKLKINDAIRATVDWEKKSLEKQDLFQYTKLQIDQFLQR